MIINTISDLNLAIDRGSTTRKGHEVYFVMENNEPMSFETVQSNLSQCMQAIEFGDEPDWRPVARLVNYTDADIYAANDEWLIGLVDVA